MEHRCFYINFIVVVELRYGQRKDVLFLVVEKSCLIITTLRLNLYVMCVSFTAGQVRLAESIEHPLFMLEVRGSNPALSEDTTSYPEAKWLLGAKYAQCHRPELEA